MYLGGLTAGAAAWSPVKQRPCLVRCWVEVGFFPEYPQGCVNMWVGDLRRVPGGGADGASLKDKEKKGLTQSEVEIGKESKNIEARREVRS